MPNSYLNREDRDSATRSVGVPIEPLISGVQNTITKHVSYGIGGDTNIAGKSAGLGVEERRVLDDVTKGRELDVGNKLYPDLLLLY